MRGRGIRRRREYWTRDRVILGLHCFYRDFQFCPLSTEEYQKHAQFTGRDPATGGWSNRPWDQKYPSFYAVLKHFPSFREAWTAAGYDVDRSFLEWTPMEDWFVLESVGIIPRSEVSLMLKRSGPAIKRRLYDLGDIRSYNRWGITLTHAEKLLGLTQSVVRKYMNYGIIPYLKGNKCYFLNPADLLKIEEVDWSEPVHPEIDSLIRSAIAQRIAKMAKFGSSWRDHEVYKFHKIKERYAGRIKNPRRSAFAGELPDPPNDLTVGDWVTPTKPLESMKHGVGRRVGVIKAILYSPQTTKRKDGTYRACWVARVEFPKIRTITNEKDHRIKWTLPLDALVRVDEAKPEPRPLMMDEHSIRRRERFWKRVEEGHERFREIADQLT